MLNPSHLIVLRSLSLQTFPRFALHGKPAFPTHFVDLGFKFLLSTQRGSERSLGLCAELYDGDRDCMKYSL